MIHQEDIEFLQHYGVKGMKWGVRRDRYQLRAARKTKESSTKTKVAGANPLIIGYGATIVAMVLAQKGALYLDSGRKDAKKTGTKEFKQNSDLKKKMSSKQLQEKVVKQINPDYPGQGTKANCRRATMAYEMRRRGYDVQATKSDFASGQTHKGMRNAVGTDFGRMSWGEESFADRKTFSSYSPEKKAEVVFTALSKNPDGSRGELGLGWTMGGGHSMAWEIVNKKPVIFDTQNGKTYASVKDFAKFTPVMIEGAQTRLDNKTVNSEFIKRWVKDV